MTVDACSNGSGTGWRSAYVAGDGRGRPRRSPATGERVHADPRTPGSPTTRRTSSTAAATCFAILNAFPYTTGHLLVLPYREVADLEDLDADETAELWATVTDAVRRGQAGVRAGRASTSASTSAGRPAGRCSEHLHVHVVPRWTGDSNFMTAIANTRTLPESLADTAAQGARGLAGAVSRRRLTRLHR